MDVRVGSVVALIGSHVTDGAASFRTQFGPAAAGTAGRLVETVMTRLSASYPGEPEVQLFETQPDQYARWIHGALIAEMEADPDFGGQVRGLMRTFEADAPGRIDLLFNRPFDWDVMPDAAASPAAAKQVQESVEAYDPPPGPITIPDKPD